MPSMLTWDTDTNYETSGEGKPVVFVHGLTLDARMWESQWAVFARSMHVIGYDLRGHGLSSSPKTPYDAEVYVLQLRTLLDGLKISRPALVAHSHGAAVALHFALGNPTRIPALVLVSPDIWGAPIPEDSAYREAGKARFDPGPFEGPAATREALRAWLRSGIFEATRKNENAFRFAEGIVSEHRCAPWRNAGLSEWPDDFARLEEVRTPTLILCGEGEDSYFRNVAAAAAERIAGAQVVSFPGVGHLPNLERPAEFNRMVIDFLHAAGVCPSLPPGGEAPPVRDLRPPRRERESLIEKTVEPRARERRPEREERRRPERKRRREGEERKGPGRGERRKREGEGRPGRKRASGAGGTERRETKRHPEDRSHREGSRKREGGEERRPRKRRRRRRRREDGPARPAGEAAAPNDRRPRREESGEKKKKGWRSWFSFGKKTPPGED